MGQVKYLHVKEHRVGSGLKVPSRALEAAFVRREPKRIFPLVRHFVKAPLAVCVPAQQHAQAHLVLRIEELER